MYSLRISVLCLFFLATLSHCSSDVTNPDSPYKDKTTLSKAINVEYINYEKYSTSGDINTGLQVENAFNLCDVAVWGAFSYDETIGTPAVVPNYDDLQTFSEWGAQALNQSLFKDCPKILPHEQTVDGKYFYIVVFARWVQQNYDQQGELVYAFGGAYRSILLDPPQLWPNNNKVGMCVVEAHDIDAKYSQQYDAYYPRRLLYKAAIHELGHGLTGDNAEHNAHGNVGADCCPLTIQYMTCHQTCESATRVGEFHPFCSRSEDGLPPGHKEKIQRFQFVTTQ
jgi:hypothetical protein